MSFAWTELNSRWDAAGVVPSGRETAGGFVLSGTKLFVPDAHLSDALVVAVRTRDGSTMEDGINRRSWRSAPRCAAPNGCST